jgi:hypothetical protein
MAIKTSQCAIMAFLIAQIGVVSAQQKPTVNCINYYQKGTSTCNISATNSLLVPMSTMPQAAAQQLQNTPQTTASLLTPTDKFLANYGKPPEEFVDFYLNPTPENARRWASTYQQMQQKSREVALAWASAEQALAESEREPVDTDKRSDSALLDTAVPVQGIVNQDNGWSLRSAPSPSMVSPVFPRSNQRNLAEQTISLTYYFSANCPFCKRQNIDLKAISDKIKQKSVFTCVDITPLSATYKPDPANIDGLPCTWRTANDAEITQEQIRQTPTFKVERSGLPPETLAGYQSPAVLEGLLR